MTRDQLILYIVSTTFFVCSFLALVMVTAAALVGALP